MSKLDPNLVKKEPIVSKDQYAEEDDEAEERSLVTMVNYEQLRELYLERSPRESDTETSSNDDDVETEPVVDSELESEENTGQEHDQRRLPPNIAETSKNDEELTGATKPPNEAELILQIQNNLVMTVLWTMTCLRLK